MCSTVEEVAMEARSVRLQKSVLPGLVALMLLAGSGPSFAADHPVKAWVGKKIYSMTNLHPDPVNFRMYAVNYLLDGLIPVCSEITMLDLRKKKARLRLESSGQVYDYHFHKAAGEPFLDHLARFFGTECDRAQKVDRFEGVDLEGIETGEALVGMSRQAVAIALGYPPPHVNPDLKADRWIYWTNRFNRIAVVFDDEGKVSAIQN